MSDDRADDSSKREIDVMIKDVQARCTQVDEIMAQVRDRCEGFIIEATNKAKLIVDEAKTLTEAMREELVNLEAEKARIATTCTFDAMINLNVGGQMFTTTLTTLTRYPDTMLGAMFSGRHALVKDQNGAYFIDRNGRCFEPILDFLRAPEAYKQTLKDTGEKSGMEIEADYYGLKDLMFPTPPFVKASPVDLTSAGGHETTVTQDDDGLWYMKGNSYSRCLVKVCDTCGWGQPSRNFKIRHQEYGIAHFTTNRKITDAQPEKSFRCNWDGTYCYSV